MLLKITHHTRYQYSQPVYLEPFTVRLRPRCDAAQTLQSYSFDVTPQPSGITHCLELDGNSTETIWFDGLHDTLSIAVQAQVETHYGDPFGFLVTDSSALTLPVKYQQHAELALTPYLDCDKIRSDSQVMEFAQQLERAANHETLPFLSQLSQEIYSRLDYLLREHGDPWAPEETLMKGQGSCRDFAMLFIEVCRSAGIAARFVSGYCIGEEAASSSDMHAWAEVYLPGAGWRGYDPSRGLLVTDDYIAVAAGQRSQDAAPTSGHFRGEATSSLDAEISIDVLESNAAAV